MSIFVEHHLPCPSCNAPVGYELVHSVNVDRRPDLRDAILDGSFQLKTCPSCGAEMRAEPEFVYLDMGRRQYIGVWPASKRRDWQACAAKTRAVFDGALGKDAPGSARKIGAALEVRAVFGWPALVEKIVAREAGIDDRSLEAAKVVAMRSQDESPLPGRMELRLVSAIDGDAVLAWLGSSDATDPPQPMRVSRRLIAEMDAEPDKWRALREGVAEGDVVDFQREMLAA